MVNPFIEEIVSQVSAATDMPHDDVRSLVEVPPKPEMGDYALPCFRFAKTLRKAPNQIARDLGVSIRPGGRIARVRAEGPYLNFYVSQTEFVRETLSEILARPGQYGRSEVGSGKTVVIDFSSPDVSKPFTIAHIRSTAIGNSLCRLYKATGWNVIGINHLGDWGAKHGMSIAAYKRWGDDNAIRENPPYELFNLYVRYNAEMEKDPSLGNAVKYWTKKLEGGRHRSASAMELVQRRDGQGLQADLRTAGCHVCGIYRREFLPRQGRTRDRRTEDQGACRGE